MEKSLSFLSISPVVREHSACSYARSFFEKLLYTRGVFPLYENSELRERGKRAGKNLLAQKLSRALGIIPYIRICVTVREYQFFQDNIIRICNNKMNDNSVEAKKVSGFTDCMHHSNYTAASYF